MTVPATKRWLARASTWRPSFRTAKKVLFGAFGVLACTPLAFAQAAMPEASAIAVPRSWHLGLSAFSPTSHETFAGSGLGLAGLYAYSISPRTQLGVRMAYHHIPQTPSLHQLNYGLRFQHRVAGLAEQGGRIYVAYGLLMQMLKESSVEGAPTAHDTEMSVGAEFPVASAMCFVELGFHYSKWRPFASQAVDLSHLTWTIGRVFP